MTQTEFNQKIDEAVNAYVAGGGIHLTPHQVKQLKGGMFGFVNAVPIRHLFAVKLEPPGVDRPGDLIILLLSRSEEECMSIDIFLPETEKNGSGSVH